MSFIFWNAPNVKFNRLEKQKLNSTLDLINTEKMHGRQMLYLQVTIFQAKTITSTHMQKFILTEQIHHVDINTEKIKERLKQRETTGY